MRLYNTFYHKMYCLPAHRIAIYKIFQEEMIMLSVLAKPLGYIMYLCFRLTGNYAAAILFFTFVTKIILLPISIWVHKNGIKIVKLTPALNRIKIRYFGDADRIADETQALYKKEKYNPLASLIPLAIQIILLIGLIQVIYNPLTHLFHMDDSDAGRLTAAYCTVSGVNPDSGSLQLQAVRAIQDGGPAELTDSVDPGLLAQIRALDLDFMGISLGDIPSVSGGILLLVPLLAGLAALLLCICQGKLNPLQAEQGKWEQLGTDSVSVGISLILGFFVPAGVGFYWICSNLVSILQQMLLNVIVPPSRYIDYEELNSSKKELAELEGLGGKRKWYEHDPNARREKADYKRFFSVANKHLVFYSEGSGFYKYFRRLIAYLLEHSNLVIHYVTGDPDDQIFRIAETEKRIRAYYIGEKRLITLMMKMDADIVVMTMPDIENYHIKRSYVRQDIEYIYMLHGCTSVHMAMREKALDHYDTVFCPGPYQAAEIRYAEKLHELPPKTILETGYGLIEDLVDEYEKPDPRPRSRPQILIAPSYQADNIMDSCIDGLLEQLTGRGYRIIVRPHPQYIRRAPQKIEAFAQRHKRELEENLFEFQTNFAAADTVYMSDVVITDWSSISCEFSFTTLKPTLYINTPMKVINPHYTEYPMKPLDITLRSRLGEELEVSEIENAAQIVSEMLEKKELYQNKILETRNEIMPQFGHSAEIGGKYILSCLTGGKKRKENKQ